MLTTKLKLTYETVVNEAESYPVIVVAAGMSSRMQGINKQLIDIGGIPVIIRTLKVFESSPFISRIILVAKQDDILQMQRLTDEYSITKLTDIVSGGADRHGSVMNGIARLNESETKVLIHDGARPFVDDVIIGNVASVLCDEVGVVCAVAVRDTVKRSDGNGYVKETLERDELYLIQTPQGISVAEYKAACEKLGDAEKYTDDAAVLEAAGKLVRIVEGSPRNIKITTVRDLETAKLYLGEDL